MKMWQNDRKGDEDRIVFITSTVLVGQKRDLISKFTSTGKFTLPFDVTVGEKAGE